MMDERRFQDGGDSGFALILAILSLLLLTFLGLTLAATTSTELQIATNYRWSQQAYYNAEAGLAVAKAYLTLPTIEPILPAVRSWDQPADGSRPGPVWPPPPLTSSPAVRNDQWGNAPRNMEPKMNPTDASSQCDWFGYGAGYGLVLDDGDSSPDPELPLQNKTAIQFPGQPAPIPIRGAFTVWVRRDLAYRTVPAEPNTIRDDTTGEILILTAEGVAPATGAAFGDTSAGGRQFYANRAVRVLQAKVRVAAAGNACKGTLPQASETGFHCLELDAPAP
jgi:hypothetical protein